MSFCLVTSHQGHHKDQKKCSTPQATMTSDWQMRLDGGLNLGRIECLELVFGIFNT